MQGVVDTTYTFFFTVLDFLQLGLLKRECCKIKVITTEVVLSLYVDKEGLCTKFNSLRTTNFGYTLSMSILQYEDVLLDSIFTYKYQEKFTEFVIDKHVRYVFK